MFRLMAAVALVVVKIWFIHLKALEMRMGKLVLDFFVAQILPEKINKMLSLNILGFIDVLLTVCVVSHALPEFWRKFLFRPWFSYIFFKRINI